MGIILVVPKRAHTPLIIKIKYTSTNNTVEYEAYIIRMETTLSLGVEKIDNFGDLNLIISQIRWEWKVKQENLKSCYKYIENLRAKF